MTRKHRLIDLIVLMAVFVFCANSAGGEELALQPQADPAQLETLWKWIVPEEGAQLAKEQRQRTVAPSGRQARLNPSAFERILDLAPMEFTSDATEASVEITLPMPDGTFARFRIVESPILAPEVAERFPEIRTYSGQRVDDPTVTMRLSWTPVGLHALVLTRDEAVLLARSGPEDPSLYTATYGSAAPEARAPMECVTPPAAELVSRIEAGMTLSLASIRVGSVLRTFRLAVAATGEYTDHFRQPGDTDDDAKNRAFATIVQMFNAVNVFYERELAIRLELVSDTNVIFVDPDGDPYPDPNWEWALMHEANQKTLDDVIGSDNYDLGQVFGITNHGGVVGGLVCLFEEKAKVALGDGDPTSILDVNIVLHETGHQFSASHTFNVFADNQRVPDAAYEPGSGSTIMSYAGLPASDPDGDRNIQPLIDRYFHAKSREEILTYITAGNGACAVETATVNSEPSVDAGQAHTIPRETPFTLTATGSDPDGDPLTFCWEEYDLGAISPPDTDADGQARPILRSYPPVPEAQRLFPSLPFILNDANVPPEHDASGFLIAEALPTIDRMMTFRVTVRDNRLGGGGADWAETQVVVDASSGPFAVTTPNSPVAWLTGSSQTVTWDVANSDLAPINCASVNILLSEDGGLTFPVVLAASTPNDGSETVVVPEISTNSARVKVEAVDNIFFDISDADFTLNAPPVLTCNDMTLSTDPGQCSAVADYDLSVTDDQSAVTVSCSPPSGSKLPKGVNQVQCEATDIHGATDTCNFTVTVEDSEPPFIGSISADPPSLWPPNHKMVSVGVDVSVTDNCDSNPVCKITSVGSNEPVDGLGDGDTAPDWEITGDLTLNLRAERSGGGDGRVYTITVRCTDASRNSSTATTEVTVPHDG